jgi:cell pole-organizing protein PopZ
MQIRELSKPIKASQLNESLAQKFGYKLNLAEFSDVQLEDARNKLRTKLSQFEVSESYDSVATSPQYQKTRIMLDCINQELLEREEGKCSDCHKDPCECEVDESMDNEASEKKAAMSKKIKADKMKEKAMEARIPSSWINSALERIELDETDSEELAAELVTRYDLSESRANYIVYLAEGEEEKAENIMASKDMVDQITGWLEDTAALKAEQLLELQDSIRETMGSAVAQQYVDAVKPALEAIYTTLETSRQGLAKGLAILSGGEVDTMGTPAPDAMGAPEGGEDAMGAPDMGGEELPTEPAPELAGREKRESVDYSRRLGMLLASTQSKKK